MEKSIFKLSIDHVSDICKIGNVIILTESETPIRIVLGQARFAGLVCQEIA